MSLGAALRLVSRATATKARYLCLAIDRRPPANAALGSSGLRANPNPAEAEFWPVAPGPCHSEGLLIREITAAAGLGATRLHQILKSPEAAEVAERLSVLRELEWPAPKRVRMKTNTSSGSADPGPT